MASLVSSVGKEPACNAGDPCLIPVVIKIRWRRDRLPIPGFLGFSGGSAAMRETWVQTLGWEDTLEKRKCSVLVHGVANSWT